MSTKNDRKIEFKKLKMDFKLITPDIATSMLLKNSSKGSIKRDLINHFTYAMKNDQWLKNFDPICFDQANNLLDGQHRLLSIMSSGIAKPFVIMQFINADEMELILPLILDDIEGILDDAQSKSSKEKFSMN